MRRIAFLVLMLAGFAASLACAQSNVSMPWLRGTVRGQQSTALFMRLEAHRSGDVTLVAASSSLAKSVEMREARRSKNGWKSHAVGKLQIPAGSSLELKPGAAHLLLVGLRRPIRKGEWVPITLVFETQDSRRYAVEVKAEAMAVGAKSHWHSH